MLAIIAFELILLFSWVYSSIHFLAHYPILIICIIYQRIFVVYLFQYHWLYPFKGNFPRIRDLFLFGALLPVRTMLSWWIISSISVDYMNKIINYLHMSENNLGVHLYQDIKESNQTKRTQVIKFSVKWFLMAVQWGYIYTLKAHMWNYIVK